MILIVLDRPPMNPIVHLPKDITPNAKDIWVRNWSNMDNSFVYKNLYTLSCFFNPINNKAVKILLKII